MKKIIITLVTIIGCVQLVNAQSYGNDMKQIISVNYQINIPTASSTDFIKHASFEGININWAYFVTEHITVGLDLSYNNYHQKFSQRVYRPNDYTAINAAQYRYTQCFPLKAQAKYYFTPYNNVKLYAGLGIGALSAGQHIVVQDIDMWHNNWGFLLSPEVGVNIPFGVGNNWGANITAGYNWATNDSNFGNIKIDNRQSFYFNVGLFFALGNF